MAYSKDVELRVQADFPGELTEVAREALAALPDVTDRVVRCVLHLAAGRIEQLTHYVECAQRDWRDVIWWAECDHGAPNSSSRRLRDFNQPFPGTLRGESEGEPPR